MITGTEIRNKITPEMKQAAKVCFIAMAYRETIRPTVEAYHRRVLNELGYPNLTEKTSYLMPDTTAKIYFARLDEEKEKAGFHGLEPGYCPLLIAETMVRDAEHVLIAAMQPLTKIKDAHQLLCAGLDKYERYIDLTMRLLAPFVDTKI